jgi:nucleotide-binding universal stress UspA family protein
MRNAVSPSPQSEMKLAGRRVLVCVDRSPFSETCVPYAVSLAKTFGSELTLAHVLEPRREQTSDALGWEISRQEARGYLERLQREVSEALGRPVEIRLEQGRPADRIVALMRETASDLTVLASRGEGSATNLGSTVQQVLAEARSSLFIVHPSSIAQTVVVPKRILVPLDGSLRTESVLPTVARLAAFPGADVLLVHVVQEPVPSALLRAAEDMDLAQKLAQRLEASAKKYLQVFQQQLAREVPSVRALIVRHTNAHQCLLEILQKEQSDLVVLSAHGSACDSSLSFGSVTAYLLTHSAVPLLVLQDLVVDEVHRTQDADAQLAPPSPRASYAAESV